MAVPCRGLDGARGPMPFQSTGLSQDHRLLIVQEKVFDCYFFVGRGGGMLRSVA